MRDLTLLGLVAAAPVVMGVTDGSLAGATEGISAGGAILALGVMLLRKMDKLERRVKKIDSRVMRVLSRARCAAGEESESEGDEDDAEERD